MKRWLQAGQAVWLAAALAAGAIIGFGMGRLKQEPFPEAQPAFAWLEEEERLITPVEEPEENLFRVETDAPPAAPSAVPEADTGFALEVIQSSEAKSGARVLIYHTHTYEAYAQDPDSPYRETEKWRTADEKYNMVRVGEELAGLLRGLGLEVVHDTTAFEPPDLSGSYARSLEMLERRTAAGERYDLYIDLHRDAYAASQTGPNTAQWGGRELARLMVLIGKGEGQVGQGFAQKPNWQENLKLAQAVTDGLNSQVQGLCREVRLKSGRFNQHISTGCILIEAGNNRNTLQQVLDAMPYLADALVQALEMP